MNNLGESRRDAGDAHHCHQRHAEDDSQVPISQQITIGHMGISHLAFWIQGCRKPKTDKKKEEEGQPEPKGPTSMPVSYTHLRAHETDSYLVCRLLLEKKKQ